MTAGDAISWNVAERVAKAVSGREPFSSSYLSASLEIDFDELTRQAEALVQQETRLVSQSGAARARVVDRTDWVQANIKSMRRLLNPLTERFASKSKGPVSFFGRNATGAELGLVLGWMSMRVLGQYDSLLFEDQDPAEQDMVYYVGPNILALEKRYAFPPREFRLWIALHECTHRAQFTGVPWLGKYFRAQVEALTNSLQIDSKGLTKALKAVADDIKSGGSVDVVDGGLLSMLATDEQRATVQRLQGLMALLEGHGEVTMSRAGADLIPGAERFHRVLHERRHSAKGVSKVMQKVLGLDAKMRQYEDGARFVEAVEAAGGERLIDQLWHAPETLPTHDEIKQPQLWIDRMAVAETKR